MYVRGGGCVAAALQPDIRDGKGSGNRSLRSCADPPYLRCEAEVSVQLDSGKRKIRAVNVVEYNHEPKQRQESPA